MNVKVQQCELKLEHAREEIHTKGGELAVKNSKLADVEMEVKLLQLRKAILTSQKEDRLEEKIKISEFYVRRKSFGAYLNFILYAASTGQ